jgi:hypothetical protein
MTLYAFKSAAWFLLLLWTTHVNATPFRGSFHRHPQRQQKHRRTQMGMDEWTWSPTQSPTFTATQSPTTIPTQIPTSMPFTATPTTLPLTATPTTGPSLTPPPTPPTVSVVPTPAAPTALFRVSLLDFQLDYIGETTDASIQQVTESYLAENMMFDNLVGVELLDESRRQLQQQQQDSNSIFFSGNAIFSEQPVPSIQAVQESQIVALDDTEALQQAFDDTNNANIEVQQVVFPETDTPASSSSSSPWNTGLIAGVAVAGAAVVLLLVVVLYVRYRTFHANNEKSSAVVTETSSSNVKSVVLEQETTFVKYTPDDFELTNGRSANNAQRDMEDDCAASLEMDEYSLSAVSADSSIKTKDTDQRKQSLLKKLALYQKTEKKSPTKEQQLAMPEALYVPGASRSTGTNYSVYTTASDIPRAPTPTKLSAATAAAATTSLLGINDDDDDDEEGQEVDLLDLLPSLSDSSGSSPRMTQQGLSPGVVVSPKAQRPQIMVGRWRQQQQQQRSLSPKVVSPQTQGPHDIASTTWQHAPITITSVRTYSDGPSDEMTIELEQDLTNFSIPMVSPEQQLQQQPPSPPRIVRNCKSPPLPPTKRGVTQAKKENDGSYDAGSYDGSYNSCLSGPEVLEDLDALSREKNDAKRAEF